MESVLNILEHELAKDLPDWANYIAMDKNGMIFVYQYKPKKHSDYWMGSRIKNLGWVGPRLWKAGNNGWENSLKPVRENIDPKYSGE